MKKMKALVKARPEKGLWMEEVPVPEPGLNDVIIKVKKSAICGTDLHIYEWDAWSQKTIKTPMTIGHEYMGFIEKMGAGVTNLKIGERVTEKGILHAVIAVTVAGGRNTFVKTQLESEFISMVRLPNM